MPAHTTWKQKVWVFLSGIAIGEFIRWFARELGKDLFFGSVSDWLQSRVAAVTTIGAARAIVDALGLVAPPIIGVLAAILIYRLGQRSLRGTRAPSPRCTYRPTDTEMPPSWRRWRWWHTIWAHAPFHSYKHRKRLEFIDSWEDYFAERAGQNVPQASALPSAKPHRTPASHPTAQTEYNLTNLDLKWKRGRLVANARAAVIKIAAEYLDEWEFLRQLQLSQAYLEVRPFLSGNFDRLLNGRTLIVKNSLSSLPGTALAFLDEIDRLEKEWGLT